MKTIKRLSTMLLAVCALLAWLCAPALAAEGSVVDPTLVFSPKSTLTVFVDGKASDEMSDEYPFGEEVTLSAPEVSGKSFRYWTNGSGQVIAYSEDIALSMYAHTSVGAVYGEPAEAGPVAAFLSITRTTDQIIFNAIATSAGNDITEAGIRYSKTKKTTDELMGDDGVTVEQADVTGTNWMLPVMMTTEGGEIDEDTTYYAVAYAVTGGKTVHSDVRAVRLADLESGASMVAGLGGDVRLPSSLGGSLCSVTFDSNGGGGVMEPQGLVQGKKTELRENAFTRSGYEFREWNTQANGKGASYADGASITASGDVTLYAQWEKPKASVTKAPKAKTGLAYTGSSQALVSAGTAEGGKMLYAMTTAAAAPAADKYSASVPKATKVGTYYVWYKVKGDEGYGDTKAKSVKVVIDKLSIAKAKVTLKMTSCTFDGKAQKPDVKSVVLAGTELKSGADYAVSYKDNNKVGIATATVTGKGNYKGTATATFRVTLGKARLTTVGSAAWSTFTASWKEVAGAQAYQLQYRKAGGKWKTVTVEGVSKRVGSLKDGALYQFRVRAVSGEDKGAWSKVARRYLRRLKRVSAKIKKAGTVAVTWEADSQANAGYVVLVRYEKDGKIVARKNVAAGKTSATVSGLKAGKSLWVQVRPMRESGGVTYAGVLRGTWAKA